jgi:hypothetical protein
MKKLLFSSLAFLLGALSACSATAPAGKCDSVTCAAGQICDGNTGMCLTPDKCAAVTCTNGQVCTSATGTCANPAFPSLGVQLDRIGRPAVNTALINPYDIYRPFMPNGPTENGDASKDKYNTDPIPANWVNNWGRAINMNIAILDGLDGGTCGNQAFFVGGNTYATLATVLANDALLVDTTKGSCTAYLGAETMSATECGGRTLSMDVIDATYSALVGAATTDGIAQTTAPMAAFPFFTAPR